jgi:hypothetical protein
VHHIQGIHIVNTREDKTAKEAQAPSLPRHFSSEKIISEALKGLSHEIVLTSDDMYGSF